MSFRRHYNTQTGRHKIPRLFLVLGGLFVVLILALFIHSCASSGGPAENINEALDMNSAPPTISSGEYDVLVSNWNQFAESFSNHYKIIGEDAATPEAVVQTLEDWTQVYMGSMSPEFEKELAALSDEVPSSSFHEYAEFMMAQRQTPVPDLTPSISQAEMATALNQIAKVEIQGQTPDYVTQETVKNIIYMNDFCAFFAGEKKAMHRRGIDTNINQCSQAGTAGKYPYLDALVKLDSPFYRQ